MNDDELRQEVRHHDREIDDIHDELSLLWAEVAEAPRLTVGAEPPASPEEGDLWVDTNSTPTLNDVTAWRCMNGDCSAWGAELMPEWSTSEISSWECPRCQWRPVLLTEHGVQLVRIRAMHMEDRDPF